LIFALYEHPKGVSAQDGAGVIYDLTRNRAALAPEHVGGPALVWQLPGIESMFVPDRHKGTPALAVDVELDSATDWVFRCDRVDFPPGGIAYRHAHPGPGIRRLLFGELTIDAPGHTHTYGAGDAWFEGADYAVLATSSASDETAFVRVLLLPAQWAGKRTIRYLDPADDEKPKLQRATILLEAPIQL
jgi:quercetin dioxygenase-like cupin family protein